MHEAELALVIKGPAKKVSQANWRSAVFGYTCLIDVSARGEGRRTWKAGSWLGKSFDTFAPIGPCIVTADEIPEPNDLVVRFWNDGQLRHNYNTDDMEHRVPELVEFASTIMTLNTGDLIACGTNHEGLGALQDGETIEIEIEQIGRMSLKVADPLKRTGSAGSIWAPTRPTPTPSNATARKVRPDCNHRRAGPLRFDVDRVAFDPDLINRYRRRHRPADQFAGAHVELGEMQRALDQMPHELTTRKRRVAVAANVAQRVKHPLDIRQDQAFAIDRDPSHLARR